MSKGIEEDAFVPEEKKMLKLIVTNNGIHVKEKARQAKLNAFVNWFEKGVLSSIFNDSNSKEKMIPGK